ncbi:ATP-grasp fold amidoligase family protein [Thomasclavelia spiroformis]|uniref:ATP-grasp fold amidoligase family protein n=1 Tax=Thomasclavelia spiroformis TaxID=29348 RepID=UPI00241DD498|nr:ATP-grasp fold amidoligase family protein [Thomasclavelia spiroformis]
MNGVVKMIMVVINRFSNPKSNFYAVNFNKLNLRIENPNINQSVKKPKKFDEMIAIAGKLSKYLTHVCIDLYNADGKICFSEFTFHHWDGFSNIYPVKWEKELGNWIIINF